MKFEKESRSILLPPPAGLMIASRDFLQKLKFDKNEQMNEHFCCCCQRVDESVSIFSKSLDGKPETVLLPVVHLLAKFGSISQSGDPLSTKTHPNYCSPIIIIGTRVAYWRSRSGSIDAGTGCDAYRRRRRYGSSKR